MSNEMQWQVICRFPGWEQNGHTSPAYGVEYLITTGIIAEAPENDEDWLNYDPQQIIVDEFKKQYEKTIGKKFNGEVLFVRQSDFVILESTR